MIDLRRAVTIALVASTSGCASGVHEPARLVTIRVIDDSVKLIRSATGASLLADIRVVNRSESILFFKAGCGPALQRKIGTTWQTVWGDQPCVLVDYPAKRIAPGDSVTTFARFAGSTPRHGWPIADPRVEPGGVYRFVVMLGTGVDRLGRKIEKLFDDDHRATESFTVYEVRR